MLREPEAEAALEHLREARRELARAICGLLELEEELAHKLQGEARP